MRASGVRAGADHRLIAAMVADWADRTPDAPAVGVAGAASHSFATWSRRSNQVARAPTAVGVGSDAAVGYRGRIAVLWAEVLAGASAVRAAGVPLNWRLSANETAEILTDAGPGVVLVEPEFLPLLGYETDATARPMIMVGDAAPVAYDD